MNAMRPIARFPGARLGVVLVLGVAFAAAAAPLRTDPRANGASASALPDTPGGPAGEVYAVDRYTIDGGGGSSSGGNYEIQGTLGQPDADPLQPSTGGTFEITGGFWPGLSPAAPQPDALFANGFE